jgi:DNA-binding MarR family transcriptional regulator
MMRSTMRSVMRTAAPTAHEGPESRLAPGDHELLRLWLRLFTCTSMIERILGSRLKKEFGSTLPRFDLLAQLERVPDGLRMQELSSRLLVTGGNVTWLVGSLVREGFVTRRRAADDGRSAIVKLTAAGRRYFMRMARAHGEWVAELLQDVPAAERDRLNAMLGVIKGSLHLREERE